jgi:hypothetical protein
MEIITSLYSDLSGVGEQFDVFKFFSLFVLIKNCDSRISYLFNPKNNKNKLNILQPILESTTSKIPVGLIYLGNMFLFINDELFNTILLI